MKAASSGPGLSKEGASQRYENRRRGSTQALYNMGTDEYSTSVLVTGGVGFVGSHIAEALLKQGSSNSVIVVYDIFNSETTLSAEKQENAEILRRAAKESGAELHIVHGDIRDKEKLLETIADHSITGCIHVGGMVDDRRSVTHPEEYIDVNIKGTATLLAALGESGVKMVVQASTRSGETYTLFHHISD